MRIVRYLLDVIKFSIDSSRWVYVVMFFALFGTILEFAALSVLIPLSQHINHSRMSAISRAWNAIVESVGATPDTKTWFELFLGLLLLRVLLQFGYSVLTSSVARDVTARLASGAFGKFIVQTSLLDIQRQKIGHFIAIAGDEASRAGQIFLYFSQLLIALLSVLVTVTAMSIFSWRLAAGVAIFVAITGVAILQSTRRIFQLGSVVKAESRVATSTFLDALNSLRSVRSIGGEKYVVRQYTDQINKYNRTLFRVDFTGHAQKGLPLIILLVLIFSAILLLSADRLLRFDMASTLASMILLMRFFPSAGACLSNGMKLLADLRAAHDVVSVAQAPAAPADDGRRPFDEPIREIALSELSFSYDDAGQRVLDQLTYTFRAGSSYAICGPSGSGKSTLVDLILGLVPSEAKAIRVNGIPLSDLDMHDFRKRVVLVEQQSRIFNDTVRNNIVFGLETPDSRLREALELSGFDQVLSQMPHGLETMLDYQGSNLSGGQRQRLGMARALLRNPDVLVLDESTSALDAATRDVILSNILRHFSNGIVIVVTHDPFVMAKMDQTLILTAHARPGEASGHQDDPDRRDTELSTEKDLGLREAPQLRGQGVAVTGAPRAE
jgi:ABC-type multidrug transport system fused ATPase/permease subunit